MCQRLKTTACILILHSVVCQLHLNKDGGMESGEPLLCTDALTEHLGVQETTRPEPQG